LRRDVVKNDRDVTRAELDQPPDEKCDHDEDGHDDRDQAADPTDDERRRARALSARGLANLSLKGDVVLALRLRHDGAS
jgi:hypothetical protein